MDHQQDREGQPGVNEGRRKLVKAAAVAGGAAVAVAALPGEWKKPLATIGGVPAHAQTSVNSIVLADAQVTVNFDRLSRGVTPPLFCTFTYVDPLCEIDDTTTIWVKVEPCGTILSDFQLLPDLTEPVGAVTPCAGKLVLMFTPCPQGASTSLLGSVLIQLKKGTRVSNVLTGSFDIAPA